MATSGAVTAPPRGRQVRNPLSLRRVETAVSRSAAVFGFIFLAQSAPALLSQVHNTHPAWNAVMIGGLLASMLCALVASIVRRWVQIASTAVAGIYLVALATWPFAVLDPAAATHDSSWLYGIMTVATSMAAIGLPVRWAAIYLVSIPLIYAIIRVTPPGGEVAVLRAALDSFYALILGGVITIIFTMLRNAAADVDRAQQTALERYSNAVRQHAIESERVQVDAIVHDSVLTTLLSAARAYTPEAKELAATMAGNAIGHLREAVAVTPDADASVAGSVLAGRIAEAADTMSQPFRVTSERIGLIGLPIPVAEALYSAAVQAMVNSLQHAGAGVDRWVEIAGTPDGGVCVRVGDRGAGFDPRTVPRERLGVRVSILERVNGAGGNADVQSEPGAGTVVTLRWPGDRGREGDGADELARLSAAAEAGEAR